MQKFTSAKTSINSRKLPMVYGRISPRSAIVFDYGCGKHTEHIESHVKAMHKTYLPYDPYNQTEEVNQFSATMVLYAMHTHFPVDVVCSNVLNVIDDEEEVQRIANHIEEIAQETGGRGYITVYEGNRSGIGRQTGPDQFQRNETLRSYLRFFRNATIKNGVIIVG